MTPGLWYDCIVDIAHGVALMVARLGCTFVLLLALSSAASAQHGAGAPALRTVPSEAKQYAFLVGQFELAVKPAATGLAQRIHGVPKLIGTWKGWRALDGFGIEDELRITDASGNPRALSHAVRYYDATSRHWIASAIDVYRGVFSASTAEWHDSAMTATSQGTDADGKPYILRGTYSDITPTTFRFRQDRSTDGGRTWNEGVLTIDAKRVAGAASH